MANILVLKTSKCCLSYFRNISTKLLEKHRLSNYDSSPVTEMSENTAVLHDSFLVVGNSWFSVDTFLWAKVTYSYNTHSVQYSHKWVRPDLSPSCSCMFVNVCMCIFILMLL